MTPQELDLHLAILRWAERIEEIATGLPDLAAPPSAARRRAALILSDALAAEFTLPVPEGVRIDDIALDGDGPSLRARRFRPSALGSAPAPTQLFLHGGGFIGGTIDETLNDRICAARALDAGIQIVSLEYRLAPEHTYPAAAHDAISALTALRHDRGVDAERLGIGGNSAGATIAASAAILLRDDDAPPLHHVDLEVVPAALRPVGDSAKEYRAGFGLDDADSLAVAYLGTAAALDDLPHAASPLDVDDLGGLPPTLIMVAEHDPLRDSGVAYAGRLRDAGVDVTEHVGRGHLHGSPGLTAALPIARDWQRRHADALRVAYVTAPAG